MEFKTNDKITYLGYPGIITKVNEEMTGITTYNVLVERENGKVKVTNIYNAGGAIENI